jgi:AcrR family transcriptional regulator
VGAHSRLPRRYDGEVPDRRPQDARRRRQTPDERREHIARAARDVFAANGLDGARTADIAKAAGVTVTVLYRHFRSKEEVFEEAILAPVERLAGELLAITSQFRHLSAEQRLEQTRETHRRLIVAISEIAPLLGVALFSNRAAGEAFYTERFAPVVERVTRALGEAMPPRVRRIVEPRTFFLLLLGLYAGVSEDARLRGSEVDVEALAAEVSDVIAFGAFADRSR